MVISSKDFLQSNSRLKVSANRSLNLPIIIPFTHLFTVRSNTWKSAVMLFGTYSYSMLFSVSREVTSFVFWPRKTFHIKSANYSRFPNFSLTVFMYGITIMYSCMVSLYLLCVLKLLQCYCDA